MADYDFTNCLSPLDFELLSKDLLEAELGIQLESFSEGRDNGIDLRYAPLRGMKTIQLIVQCKRYSAYSNLKSALKNSELPKIQKLSPERYILTTSVSLSTHQVDEIKALLSPYVQSTGDIYGRERLNSLLTKHPEIERRNIKLWITSGGVLDAIINAGTHQISRDEVEHTLAAAKIYVKNKSFDEALAILEEHHVCIISGLPGIGKTTLARMLLLYFYKKEFDVIKITKDILEAHAVGYHSKRRFYFYDDFLGQTSFADKLNKNEDHRLLDFMASIRESMESVFVLTTREYILNQAKLNYEKLSRAKFDHQTCIIDLSKYSRKIRAQILYNHLHFSKLPRTYIENLIGIKGYLKIVDHKNYNPRLIKHLTDSLWIGDISPTDYLAFFLQKLDNPVDIWDHVFRNQLSDKARNLLFVLTTMPSEVCKSDLEHAFSSFHNAYCAKFNIAHSVVDFKNALKELDGTFVSTRKIQQSVLVRFQNPSIRDFMQCLLLAGESLSDVIDSFVFFEQPQWLAVKLSEIHPQVQLDKLAHYAEQIVTSCQRLFEIGGCSFFVLGSEKWSRLIFPSPNPAERLKALGRMLDKHKVQNGIDWITEKISALAVDLEAGKIAPSLVVRSIEAFNNLDYLDPYQVTNFNTILKDKAMGVLTDLDEYETLAYLVNAVPQSFSEVEVETLRDKYSDFAADYAVNCGLDNPEELRELAFRICNIGELIGADTDSAQETLEDFAKEIEKKEATRWDDYDPDEGGGYSAECSDTEIDSMFNTLKS